MATFGLRVSGSRALATHYGKGSGQSLGVWVRSACWLPSNPRRAALGASASHSRTRRYTSSVAAFSSQQQSNRTSEYDYDLFTIGAGSGGVRASRMAASLHGAKVAVCDLPYSPIATDETGGAGGTCVLRGCVPKKLFVYASEFREVFKDARGFGFDVDPGAPQDWALFLDKKRKEIKRLNGVYHNLLKNAGVDFFEGRGKVVDAHTVSVGDKTFTARNILVATGARAFVPGFEGHEHCIVSDNILELNNIPKKLIVIGSGYIAVEFASIFKGLGSEVHLVFRKDHPLNGFDDEVREFAAAEYAKNGIHLHPGFSPVAVTTDESSGTLSLRAKTQSGKEIVIDGADHVLAATGRKPNVKKLGLEDVGVKVGHKGAIAVDELSRTSVENIWAIGDVTDRMNLTPVAIMEGMALVKTLFGGEDTAPDHSNVATAVFSHPEIGTVGLTEAKAKAVYGGDLDIYTSSFKPMRNTISGNEGKAFMKVIVHRKTDRIVGIHMVGPSAGEIMQGFGVAMKMGLTKRQLDSTVGIHPTSAEELVTMRTMTRHVD